MTRSTLRKGFTFIELLISVAVLTIVGAAIYEGYARTFEVVRLGRIKSVATALATEEFEIMRNMPYAEVGLQAGVPAGSILRFRTIEKDGLRFFATTTIRNVDDQFDGQVGSTTAPDLAPADYKFVQIDLMCIACRPNDTLSFSTIIAPRGLETSTNNGSLFIKIFNANGQPVQGATVEVTNASVTPALSISELSNVQGQLQLVDVPTSTEGYRIRITKGGYSVDETRTPGDTGNPNPVNRHASVIKGQLTQASFAIDEVSSVQIKSVDAACAPVGNMPLRMQGVKLIGTSPDVLKFNNTYTTNGSGELSLSDVEWDTYYISRNGGSRYIAGSIPMLPLSVSPNSTHAVTLVTVPASGNALLISVRDAGTQLPISGADVEIAGPSNRTEVTGQGHINQTDWSGGAGQSVIGDDTMYETSDGNIETLATSGQISLKQILGSYATQGELISSVFDVGTTSSFYTLSWTPANQPALTGSEPVRFQLAASTEAATTTWNYVGPDGTSSTYYTSSGSAIHTSLSGNRYIRYKVFLRTSDTAHTPTISDVSVTYGSACVAPGQVFFESIGTGTYTVDVSKTGYQTASNQVTVGSGYTAYEILLSQ